MSARDDYPFAAGLSRGALPYGADREVGLALDEIDRLRAEVAELRAWKADAEAWVLTGRLCEHLSTEGDGQ